MWTTVLFLGLGMAIDPLRLGIAVVLVSRRRPVMNLLAFWLGGMLAGAALGLAVLILLRDVALAAIKSAASAVNDVRSTVVFLSGGRLQITLGVLALLSVVALLVREHVRARARIGAGGDASDILTKPGKPGIFARLGAMNHNFLQRGFVWPAFVVGLGSATPPIECVMVLTVIMASGVAIGTQVCAFVVFTLIMLAVIEIPLIAYLAMPQRTQAVMQYLQNGVQLYRHRISQGALSIAGVVFMAQGIGSL